MDDSAEESIYRDRASERRSGHGLSQSLQAIQEASGYAQVDDSDGLHVKKGLDFEALHKRRQELEVEERRRAEETLLEREPPSEDCKTLVETLGTYFFTKRLGRTRNVDVKAKFLPGAMVFAYDFKHRLPKVQMDPNARPGPSRIVVQSVPEQIAQATFTDVQSSPNKRMKTTNEQQGNEDEDDDDDIFAGVGTNYVLDVDRIKRNEVESSGPQLPKEQEPFKGYPEPEEILMKEEQSHTGPQLPEEQETFQGYPEPEEILMKEEQSYTGPQLPEGQETFQGYPEPEEILMKKEQSHTGPRLPEAQETFEGYPEPEELEQTTNKSTSEETSREEPSNKLSSLLQGYGSDEDE